jgi:diguanylate cyclase
MEKRAVMISSALNARAWLENYVGQANTPLTLILLGIRDLKQINDRYGHAKGDAVIEAAGVLIAEYADAHIANTVMVARMPGREFLIIIADSPPQTYSENMAKKLLDIMTANFGAPAQPLHISARIGIAICENNESGTELLHRASIALGRAYERKGKKMAFAPFEQSSGADITTAIDEGVRAAILQREITIVLQPQFDVTTGKLVGAEALARLQHADLGEIGAHQLFAAADRTDLREELSLLIQEQAVTIAAAWPLALDTLRLAVNLGAQELDEGSAARMLALLARTGFSENRLTLELTEESLVRNIDLAAAQLEQLRAKGIRIALDDFGTGYSSLAYLKALPLDYLKIDKSMTPDISGTGKERIVLRAIIAMAKALGLQIIAEGVERAEELEMLRAEECDFFQGYLKSPPLSADAFEAYAMQRYA